MRKNKKEKKERKNNTTTKMKREPPSLAYAALKRAFTVKSNRDIVKNISHIMNNSTLQHTIIKDVIRLEPKLVQYLPNDTDISTLFGEKVAAKLRTEALIKNYLDFPLLKNKTDEDWSLFFELVPSGAEIFDEPIIRKMVNQRPLFAVQKRACLLVLVDTLTIPICVASIVRPKSESLVTARSDNDKMREFIKNNNELYHRIRELVNESATSQLSAITSGLDDEKMQLFFSSLNNICLYDTLKSKECIYAWVKLNKRLEQLPETLATEELLLEIVRLGNVNVFKRLPMLGSGADKLYKSEELCMAVLTLDPQLIQHIEVPTSRMAEHIMNLSLLNYRFLIDSLKTVEMTWKLLREDHHIYQIEDYSFHIFIYIPDSILTFEMAVYVIDMLDLKGRKEWVYDFREKFVHQLIDNPQLLWYTIKHKPQLLTQRFLMRVIYNWPFDEDMIEYISLHCPYDVLTDLLVSMVRSESFCRDKLYSLALRYPRLIKEIKDFNDEEHFYNLLKVTEELSVRAIETDPKLLLYCVHTPKVVRMVCERNVNPFYYTNNKPL